MHWYRAKTLPALRQPLNARPAHHVDPQHGCSVTGCQAPEGYHARPLPKSGRFPGRPATDPGVQNCRTGFLGDARSRPRLGVSHASMGFRPVPRDNAVWTTSPAQMVSLPLSISFPPLLQLLRAACFRVGSASSAWPVHPRSCKNVLLQSPFVAKPIADGGSSRKTAAGPGSAGARGYVWALSRTPIADLSGAQFKFATGVSFCSAEWENFDVMFLFDVIGVDGESDLVVIAVAHQSRRPRYRMGRLGT